MGRFRFRFTVRRMMAFVAVVAIFAAAVIAVERRSARFRELAAYHLRSMEGVGGYHSGHEGDRVHHHDWNGRNCRNRRRRSSSGTPG